MPAFTSIIHITPHDRLHHPCETLPAWLLYAEEDSICTHDHCWKNPKFLEKKKKAIAITVTTTTTTSN
jgi:hypothetical protein